MHDPLADEESPGKANHCARRGNSDEAVTGKGAICFNDIVETHRWRLHETESDETEPKLQAHPARWRGVLRNEAEDERADGGGEEGGESGDETGFWFREAVLILLCEAFGCEISDKVSVHLKYPGELVDVWSGKVAKVQKTYTA